MIACDEEALLPDCLRSVAFCDEIVVVDGGSRDRTTAVARAAGARVIENPWPGFAAQRNVAIDHAEGDWILEVDADERVSDSLRKEIEQFLADPPAGVAIGAIPMAEIFLGAAIRRSAKYPKYRHRLFRRGAYRHDESRAVHEGLRTQGRTWGFEAELVHLLAGTWREAVGDAWRYSRLEAGHLPPGRRSPRAYGQELVARPAAKLAYRLIVDGGWVDGWRGLGRIALDCASDILIAVWRPRAERGAPAAAEHFGQRTVALGTVRLLGLATARTAVSAADWLRAAGDAGADVGLITDGRAPVDAALQVRRVQRFSPLCLARALDAEKQLRSVDALVAFDARTRRLVKLILWHRSLGRLVLDPTTDPHEAERSVRAATRGAPASEGSSMP